MSFFKLNFANEKNWILSNDNTDLDGAPIDIWAYVDSSYLENAREVPFSIKTKGEIVDFNVTAFGTYVVSKRLKAILESFDEINMQAIPAAVAGAPGEWFVIKFLEEVDCINHERSVIQYFPPNHPEKPNQIRGVMHLAIDELKAENRHLFKPTGWKWETIVSNDLRRRLCHAGVTGADFIEIDVC